MDGRRGVDGTRGGELGKWKAGDGDLDMVLTNQFSMDATVLLNTGGGATDPTFTIPAATSATEGFYDVVVSNDCDSVTSTPVGLIVGGPDCCISDFNGDGVSNSTDVSDFINAWFADMSGC